MPDRHVLHPRPVLPLHFQYKTQQTPTHWNFGLFHPISQIQPPTLKIGYNFRKSNVNWMFYSAFAALLRSLYSTLPSGMIFPQLSHIIPRCFGMFTIGIPKSVIRKLCLQSVCAASCLQFVHTEIATRPSLLNRVPYPYMITISYLPEYFF